MRPPAALRTGSALDGPRCLAASQAVLGLCLLACVAIEPGYLFSLDQGGISNFATLGSTVVPFAAGFSAAAAGAVLAAMALPGAAPFARFTQTLLRALAILYVLAFTTGFRYQETDLERTVHETAVISLFVFMLVATVALRLGPGRRDAGARPWSWVFGVGFVLAALTYFGALHVLFTAQLVSGAAFAVLLVRSSRAISVGPERASEASRR